MRTTYLITELRLNVDPLTQDPISRSLVVVLSVWSTSAAAFASASASAVHLWGISSGGLASLADVIAARRCLYAPNPMSLPFAASPRCFQ